MCGKPDNNNPDVWGNLLVAKCILLPWSVSKTAMIFYKIYDYIYRWNFVQYVHCMRFSLYGMNATGHPFLQVNVTIFCKTHITLYPWYLVYLNDLIHCLEYHKFDCYVPGIGPVNFMPLKFQGGKVFCPGQHTLQMQGTGTCSESWWNIVYCKLPEYSRHHRDFHGI